MTLIALGLPNHGIYDIKEVVPPLGFGGYQALIRAYPNGLRTRVAGREAQAESNAFRAPAPLTSTGPK